MGYGDQDVAETDMYIVYLFKFITKQLNIQYLFLITVFLSIFSSTIDIQVKKKNRHETIAVSIIPMADAIE